MEGVEEELDAPNEFHFDSSTSRLFLFYNGSSSSPPPQVEVPSLAELIRLDGGQQNPVRNVTIRGITFTGTRPTYLDPHGLPSAGDWGMERLAAVHAKGSEGIAIVDAVFTRLDGNAILLDGFNRYADISRNEFVLLGASGIVLWFVTLLACRRLHTSASASPFAFASFVSDIPPSQPLANNKHLTLSEMLRAGDTSTTATELVGSSLG